MAKTMNDDFFDEALNWLKNNALEGYFCSAQPTTYAEASSTYALADFTISTASFTGPTDGDTSGRKITLDQQNNVDIDTSGTATHVAICATAASPDFAANTLIAVTECASKSVTAGLQETMAAVDFEIPDPV